MKGVNANISQEEGIVGEAGEGEESLTIEIRNRESTSQRKVTRGSSREEKKMRRDNTDEIDLHISGVIKIFRILNTVF